MSATSITMLMLYREELLLLLEGCGINRLHVPGSQVSALEDDAAVRSFVRLTRDGLLPLASSGLQTYAPELRQVLTTLCDCNRELLIRTFDIHQRPWCFYIADDLGSAVAMQEDRLQDGCLRVLVGSALDICNLLLEAARASKVISVATVQPTSWDWRSMRADGMLFCGLAYRRGEEQPVSRWFAVCTRTGDVLVRKEGDDVQVFPLGLEALLSEGGMP